MNPTRSTLLLKNRSSNKQLNMVVYWSIKSAIDYAGYSLGQSQTFQGTGVWSGIKLSREPENEQTKKTNDKSLKKDDVASKSGSSDAKERK